MIKIDRKDIQLISKHSNWSEESVEKLLKGNVYNDTASWKKLLQLFFISLGVCFATAGIIFFFAYNWADLDKFIKIGMIEGLILISILFVLTSKINAISKDIILTGASILVGVLFAVFGQVYQTGANAYDFFLGWTLCISIWVIVSNFAALWLIYLVLINTSFVLYAEQVADHWSVIFVITVLFILNTTFLLIAKGLPIFSNNMNTPQWFTNTIALAAVSLATLGISIGIHDKFKTPLLFLILSAIIAYTGGLIYGSKQKSLFYLSLISFSLIIIISALFIKVSDQKGMFLFVCIFIIAAVTLVIRQLIDLQKKWTNE